MSKYHKLNRTEVFIIKAYLANGHTTEEIAKAYNIHRIVVSAIAKGDLWYLGRFDHQLGCLTSSLTHCVSQDAL